jgi:hypothetical protein
MATFGGNARGREVGGLIGGILVGAPTGVFTWILFLASLASPPGHYPWAEVVGIAALFILFTGLAIVIGRAIGGTFGPPSREEPAGSFQLESLSDERLEALWRAAGSGDLPASITPERLAALRQAILDTAQRRALELGKRSVDPH